MQSAMTRKIGLGGVMLAVLATAGCSRDERDFGRGIAGPSARLAEGSRVFGWRTQSVELLAGDQSARTTRLAPVEVSATVSNGAARDSLVSLARTVAMAQRHRTLSHTDQQGRRHVFEVERGEDLSPPTSIRHVVDGELRMQMQFRWEARPGGWLLADRRITLFEAGRPVLQHALELGRLETAAAGGGSDGPARVLAGAAGLFLPAELHAAQFSCVNEVVALAAAAAATYLAYEALKLQPWSLTAWRNFLGAVALLGATTESFVDCLLENLE
jgi:hypothetical protein